MTNCGPSRKLKKSTETKGARSLYIATPSLEWLVLARRWHVGAVRSPRKRKTSRKGSLVFLRFEFKNRCCSDRLYLTAITRWDAAQIHIGTQLAFACEFLIPAMREVRSDSPSSFSIFESPGLIPSADNLLWFCFSFSYRSASAPA